MFNHLDQIADVLNNTNQYKVIKRYNKPNYYSIPDDRHKK
ncbi:DNA polymerase III subunit epsilon [Rickettsia endosymbiont of Ixodes scapularis]|nr:DNA polymerase III subunit epsilon [Rickettsia endosymbiont of Ixodes scapularis]